jgi:dCMP deaminase
MGEIRDRIDSNLYRYPTVDDYLVNAKNKGQKGLEENWRQTKWHQRFLKLAYNIAEFSKDPSTQVGAVVVRANRSIASMGYNGFARGVADDIERYNDRSIKYEIVVHAEINAIIMAGQSLEGCTLYTVPLMPCSRCAAIIINSGISSVVSTTFRMEEPAFKFDWTIRQFYEAGIDLTLYPYDK